MWPKKSLNCFRWPWYRKVFFEMSPRQIISELWHAIEDGFDLWKGKYLSQIVSNEKKRKKDEGKKL